MELLVWELHTTMFKEAESKTDDIVTASLIFQQLFVHKAFAAVTFNGLH